MNKQYKKKEDYAIVIDDKGNEKLVLLTDNIEDILEQENKIEEMCNEVEKLQMEIPLLQKNLTSSKKNALFSLPIGLLFGLSFGYVFNLSGHGVVLSEAYKKGMLYGSLLCGLGTGLVFSLKEIVNAIKTKQELTSMEIQNFFLEKDLETERAYLQDLNDLAHKIEHEQQKKVINLDTSSTKQKLMEYQNKLKLYGKRAKEFYHKPMQEAFRNELYTNGIDVETFEDYLEEKTKRLTK